MAKTSPVVSFLPFIDMLGLIASGSSVKEVAKALEKVAKKVLEWGTLNVVTYDESKTEAVLFFKVTLIEVKEADSRNGD